jgi:DMSO/TMAO reductase YedYZ molybdopterin-dependent catalytic subunit
MPNRFLSRRQVAIFLSGFLAGLVALAFNFLLRLGGLSPYPPESALGAFLKVVPASIEEPMVQQFGDLAGQLGLLSATLVAAAVYGLLIVGFDRLSDGVLGRLTKFERLLGFSLVPWLLFGLILLPVDGDSFFGANSAFASPYNIWAFPFTLLLVQGVFALAMSPRYSVPSSPLPADASRREFIEKGAVGILALIVAVLSLGGLGSLFSQQIQPSGGSQPVDLADAPAIFRDPRLQALVDSEVTPNGSFYRVAIDVIDPVVDAATWSLLVDGLVGTTKQYSLQDIKNLPSTGQYATLECVSNNINGNLVSNAKWSGLKISDLLGDVGGVQSGAKYVVFYSKDGYSVGIPLDKAMMDDSILAYQMNGADLPVSHGYPLRAIIPGLYGMMSAKWVTHVSVVGSVYQGYWQTRGWTNNAEIYTVTFIVSPQSGGQLSLSSNGGSIIVAGYAFAGDRGVAKVEVSFDNGATWETAQLKKPLSDLTWALWAFEWKPQPGRYFILARATDGSGQVQASTVSDTFPNGATGYAYITATVSA